jgi:hypothetical protein
VVFASLVVIPQGSAVAVAVAFLLVIPEGDLLLLLPLPFGCHPRRGSAVVVAVAFWLSSPKGICFCSKPRNRGF